LALSLAFGPAEGFEAVGVSALGEEVVCCWELGGKGVGDLVVAWDGDDEDAVFGETGCLGCGEGGVEEGFAGE